MRAEEPFGVSHDLDRAIPADPAMGGAQDDLDADPLAGVDLKAMALERARFRLSK